MQDQIEVLKFEETPELKHLGVAQVRLFRQVVLRYKVIEGKEGKGFFIAPPSYKKEMPDGTENWVKWFMLDSQVFAEEVQDMIRSYVEKHMRINSNSKGTGGVFNQQPTQTYQQDRNASQQTQQSQNQYAQASRGEENLPF